MVALLLKQRLCDSAKSCYIREESLESLLLIDIRWIASARKASRNSQVPSLVGRNTLTFAQSDTCLIRTWLSVVTAGTVASRRAGWVSRQTSRADAGVEHASAPCEGALQLVESVGRDPRQGITTTAKLLGKLVCLSKDSSMPKQSRDSRCKRCCQAVARSVVDWQCTAVRSLHQLP